MLTQLVVTNYKPLEKSLVSDDEWIIEDWEIPDEPVEKVQPFGTFGGSHHYAKRIVPLIPEHKTYVEPFAGAAAVLHAKEPSEKEVLADLDEDLVFMHRFIKGLTADKVEKLKGFDWTCTESSWKRVRELSPANDLERFYKLAFIRGKGRDARPDATYPAGAALGQTTNPEKYLRASERLKNVSILRQDYRKTISANDGPDTFFFIDPPYPGEWFDKGAVIDLDEFISTLKTIKGKFIAVLNDSKENTAAFKQVGQIFRLKVREASGTGGAKQASRLFCANYRVLKSDDVEEPEFQEDLDKAVWSRAYINDLPDESFLFIEPGGEKDEDGKTMPRTLRHFPVRDMDGEFDLPHVRNAIARIPQSRIPDLSDDDLKELQEKARELLTETTRKVDVFTKSIPLIKADELGDERFVLGVVLEPDVVDA
jgi:site-specific DNA-adenine methylase